MVRDLPPASEKAYELSTSAKNKPRRSCVVCGGPITSERFFKYCKPVCRDKANAALKKARYPYQVAWKAAHAKEQTAWFRAYRHKQQAKLKAQKIQNGTTREKV